MGRELLVFDMDGVLVDVTASYRAAIVETVASFTGRRPSSESIQDYKNAGGWNNDWALSQRLIADFGVEVDYDTVVSRFNEFFLGEDGDGLIRREVWMPRPGLLERLAARFDLAIFTGRTRHEASLTLDRFAGRLNFDPVVTTDDVAAGKPAPDGLLKIAAAAPGRPLCYVGDTVDDARCARAAGVRFIGIASPAHPWRAQLDALFRAEGAWAVTGDINQLEEALANR